MLFTLLCLALGKPKRVLKPNMDDNILYVTESNISLAFQDLPAVFLLVQLGSDRDARFRTRADFLAAASSLGTRCFFAVMDGDRNTRFVKSINQREPAAFLFYRYGQLVARYSGSQSTERIVDFAMARTGIPFKTFDDYTVAQDFIESHQIAVVLYLEKAGGPLFDKYTRVAGTLRDNFSFGLCPDEVLADELGVTKVPSLVMYRSTDKGRIEYSDDLNGAELADIFAWLNYNVKPRFEPFQVDNQRAYWNNKPILLFFTSVEEEAMKEGDKVITAIAEKLTEYHAENIVVDPVMVATSGAKLISDDAIDTLKECLLPMASVLTPNIPEAEVLSGMAVKTEEDMIRAAERISENFHCAVLLKGGHQLNDANDLLYRDGSYRWFYGKRIDNPNTHGTGCTLSSAIASNLAKGFDMDASVERAKAYISGALGAMLDLGKGSGPMNHAYDITGEYVKTAEERCE